MSMRANLLAAALYGGARASVSDELSAELRLSHDEWSAAAAAGAADEDYDAFNDFEAYAPFAAALEELSDAVPNVFHLGDGWWAEYQLGDGWCLNYDVFDGDDVLRGRAQVWLSETGGSISGAWVEVGNYEAEVRA